MGKFKPNSMRLVDAPRKVELTATMGKSVQFEVPDFEANAPTSFTEGFQEAEEKEEKVEKEKEVKLDKTSPNRKRKRDEKVSVESNPWMQPNLKKKKVEKVTEVIFDP